MAFVLFIAIYTSSILLSSLGISDYGMYNVVAGFVSMFAILNAALTSCVQRYYNYEIGCHGDSGFNRVYITAVQIQILLMILAVGLSEIVGVWYIQNKLVVPSDRLYVASVIFHFSVASMALTILQVPYSAAIIAKEKMNYYAIVGIIDILLKLFVAISVQYISSDKLIYYGLLIAGVSLIDFILYFVYARIKISELKFRFVFYENLFYKMIKFSGWSSLSGFAQMMRNQGLNMILNLFFGTMINAATAISYQIKAALAGFVQNISAAVRPQLVEAYAKGEKSRSLSLMYSISKISYIFLLIMMIPVSLEIDFILHLWLGNNVPNYTNTFTIIVLITTSIDILQTPVSMIVYANGNIAKYNILTSVFGIMVLPLAYFVLRMGMHPEMVYFASLIISILIQIISIRILIELNVITTSDYMRKVVLPLLKVISASVVLPILLRMFLSEGLVRFGVVTLVSIISVSFIAYYWGLRQSERQLILYYGKMLIYKLKR